MSAIGLIAGIILIILIIVGVMIGLEAGSNFYQEVLNALYNTTGNDSTGNVFKAEIGERVCDLQFNVHGEFDEWAFSPLRVRLGEAGTDLLTGQPIQTSHPNVGSYTWSGCHEKTSALSPFNLIFYDKNGGVKSSSVVPELAFGTAIGFGEEIAIQLKFEDKQGNAIDATNNKKLFKTIELPNGSFQIPLEFSKTWVINDIKQQDYDVSIFMGRQINELNAGQPYIYNVLK